MGYSLCWAAVRGKARETVLAELELHSTGAREAIPDSPLVGAQLPDGWYLVLSNQDARFTDEETLQRLSAKSELVTCFVEEHVMCSSASGWNDGRKVWSLLHDAQQSVEHLENTGDPPASLASIRDRLRAEQERAGGTKADVDCFFDVPVEVAKAVTGFSHNEGLEGDAFEVLVTADSPTEKKKPSWMKKLFGRTT